MTASTHKSDGLRVNVTPETKAALEQRAAELDTSLAYVIRQAINLYLKGTK